MAEQTNGTETKSEEFVQKMMEHLMGDALDAGKLSNMGNRQLEQYQKIIKNKFNDMARLFKEKLILKEEKQ
jgi:hypothetical protein